MVLNQPQYVEICQESLLNLFKPEGASTVEDKIPYELLKAMLVGALSCIPYVGAPLSTGVDAVLSQLLDDKSSAETESAFANFKNSILDAVDEKFIAYDAGSIKLLIQGSTIQMATLKKNISNVIAHPNGATYKEFVRSQIVVLDNIFIDKVLKCQNKANDIHVSQLPFYCLLVTGYLSLLSDTVRYYKKWGIPIDTCDDFYKKFTDLVSAAKKWSFETYSRGLEKIRGKDTTNDLRKFNKLLNYRTQSIFYVFDYFPLWEAMDPRVYPDGVQLENCRFLFSEIQGIPVQDQTTTSPYYRLTCEQLENKFYYFNYNSYGGDLKLLCQFKQPDNNRIVAIQNIYNSNPANNTDIRNGAVLGGNNSGLPSWVQTFPDDSKEESVTMSSDVLPRVLQFQYAGGSPLNPGYGINSLYNGQESGGAEQSLLYSFPNNYQFPVNQPAAFITTWSDIREYLPVWKYPQTTYQFPGHKIAHVASFGCNKDVNNSTGVCDAFLVAFAPVQLFRYNYIFKGGQTIVSAQKCVAKDDGVGLNIDKLFENPIHHLWSMTLPVGKSITYAFDPQSPDAVKFLITVRYSCTVASKLQVNNVATSTVVGTIDLPIATQSYSTTVLSINIGNQPFGKNRFKFTAKLGKVDLINISFKLKPETTTTA